MVASIPKPTDALRNLLVRQVRAVFNDRTKGEAPVVPSADALFPPDSPIRMVHADVVAMMVGGMRALLLQMLHPVALQGVLDHSDFRHDVEGRLRRTARFIATTTYAHRDEALKAIATVNAIHTRITGTMPDGRPYSATDPRVLAWVHLAEATSFLEAYLAYADPDMPAADQDRYFEQSARVAELLGCAPVPRSRAEAFALMADMRDDLAGSPAAREVAAFLLEGEPGRRPGTVLQTLGTAAVDLLPPFARTMLGIGRPGLAALPVRAGTRAMAATIRWAFAGKR
ncbi:oxygenase MpaB family protein [Novosphingobium sp. BL-8H]|uniref:oxygenase MpaB family protein n=1 Tax=Novosphingobium sp. BL-8H TaxID=3127640 RepID=UPI0037574B7E